MTPSVRDWMATALLKSLGFGFDLALVPLLFFPNHHDNFRRVFNKLFLTMALDLECF